MKKVMLLVVAVILPFILGGCATILNGSTQKVGITTGEDKQYHVTIDGGPITTVPAIIEVKRENKDKIVHVQECPDEQVLLHKEVSGTFFINILSGGVFGSTTDSISGDMWKYEPADLKIDCLHKS